MHRKRSLFCSVARTAQRFSVFVIAQRQALHAGILYTVRTGDSAVGVGQFSQMPSGFTRLAVSPVMFLQKEIDMDRDIVEENRKQLKDNIEQDSPKKAHLLQEEILPRRAVLRGILAVSCSLFVPITLFGSLAARADPAVPTAARKVSKASVQYQYHPNGDKRCGICANFIAASNTCIRVAGPINPNGWCKLWTKKA